MAADTHPFDELSRRIAAAYAADRPDEGRRLGDAAAREHLVPRIQQLARLKVFRRDLLEDVVAHSLLRIAEDWARGKAVTWPMLQRVVVNTAVDLTRRDTKVPTVDPGECDEGQLESFMAAHGADQPRASSLETEALDRVRIDELVRELSSLNRPKWVAYVRAWEAGYRTAPDVEHHTGIKAGRARQIRMDVCQYVRAYHHDLAAWLGCQPGADEGGDAS